MAKRILVVLGTRPEAIKLAPLVRALHAAGDFEVRVASTGQHREMLRDALRIFELTADYALDAMRVAQTQSELLGTMLPQLSAVLREFAPDCVVIQGDTATTFCGALAGYLHQCCVVHVEAGLRTGDKFAPFPEEMYRCMVADIADVHCAPTPLARDHLLREGVAADRIFVTGNTAIDALRWVLANTSPPWPADLIARGVKPTTQRVVLITCHRRESFGAEMAAIMGAIRTLASRHPLVLFVFPVHLNPEVSDLAHAALSNIANVILTSPLDYAVFAHLLNACYLVMTDSGGIQEEAAELGRPVLVMRRTTERLEGVTAGTALLVGVEAAEIERHATRLLTDSTAYAQHAVPARVYGDGAAAAQIVQILRTALIAPGKN